MKINNETKQVFKDPAAIQSFRDALRVAGGALVGAVVGGISGAVAGGITGVGAGMIFQPNPDLFGKLIVGGFVVGTVTGAGGAIAMELSELIREKLLKKANDIAAAPGFEKWMLQIPLKGFEIGQVFERKEKVSTDIATPTILAGSAGMVMAGLSSMLGDSAYDKFAKDPAHHFKGQIGEWLPGEKILPKGEVSRNARPATFGDFLENDCAYISKDLLRSFIQTGKVPEEFIATKNESKTDAVIERSPKITGEYLSSALKIDDKKSSKARLSPT